MTAKYGLTLSRWATALLAIFALSLGGSSLAAQETSGKVEGTVRDPNDQPVAGAQVLIMGTSFSAQTNTGGYYFINNVPAGTYNVRAQFIGLQPAEIQNVRISAGQTVTVDYDLQGAIALEAIAITTAAQPLVPRDQVTSRTIMSGSAVHNLPIDDPLQIVTLVPGVVVGRGGAISIRGGRANEAAIFIDGAPVRSSFNSATNLNIATNALEEVAVTTGALGSEFGDAQSGVISFITRSGGPSFAGSLSYETDELFGNSVSVGLNRFEASLSGPIVGNLTFFVGGTLQGQVSDFQGKGAEDIPTYIRGGIDTTVTIAASGTDSTLFDVPHFVQFGGQCDAASNPDAAGNPVECQGRRFPNSWTTQGRLSSKLQLTYGSGSRISLSGHVDRDQALLNTMRGFSILLSEATGGTRSNSGIYVLNWVQQVTRGASSALSFNVNVSLQTDRVIAGALETQEGLDLRQPSLGLHLAPLNFIVDFENFSDDTDANTLAQGTVVNSLDSDADWDQLIFNIRTGTGTIVPFRGRNELQRSAQPRINPYGVREANPFLVQGQSFGSTLREERRFTARGNIDWQAGRYNRIKVGGEYRSASLNNTQTSWFSLRFNNIYTADPVVSAFYVQDRLDLGDVIIELGGRWDYYDARARHPVVPGRTFTHPDFTAADLDPTDTDVIDSDVWTPSSSHTALSPRLRVSFPVTEKTGFRLSYAHQVQTPNFNDMLEGANNDLSFTNTNERFGGDVDFAKTIQFEFGIRHAFDRDMVLDISMYNKDKVSDWTYRILPFFDPFADRVATVNILTNADFGNVRGLDVQLQRRFSNLFSGQASYTLQSSRSTGSDPTDFLSGISRQPFGVTGERTEAPEAALRTRDDRRHNIQGSFALTVPSDASIAFLRNVGVFGSFRFRSGLPYTRFINTGGGGLSSQGLGLAARLDEPLQSSETPWTKFINLRVTKDFSFGARNVTFYGDVRNVFNFTNKPLLYSETGDVVNEEYFESQFLTTELLGLKIDAEASGADLADGAISLSDCGSWAGAGGVPACISLQAVERRFAIGTSDDIFDLEEQTAAIAAGYEVFNGPHTLLGQPRHIRVGLQLDF